MATWLNSIGDWNTNVNAGIFGGKNAAGVMQQASGFGKAMGGLGINASNIGGIANTIGQIGAGLLAGQNQTGVGNALQTIGGLASNIPGVGGLIGAGVGVVGGLVNAAFGSHINEEFVQQTQLGANQVGSQVFNANTNGDLLNDWQNMTQMSNVSKSEVGSDGWFSNKASNKTRELNEKINAANQRQLANFNIAAQNVDTSNDLRILQNMAAYGGPINSFRKYYGFGGSLYDTPQFFSAEPQIYDDGGYLSKAKALIRQNEGWKEKPYKDAPRGKNWRSVGYGFNDSGFREKYPEGISKHYEHGITKKQAEEELDYFLNKAEKQLKSIYGKQWNDFTDSQKAAILDTYYQRPASVGKSSRFYKAVTAGEDAGRYLGVAGYDRRNKIRQDIFGGGYSGYGDWSNTESNPNPSTLQEVTPFIPVVHDLDLSGITPTEAKALELNLTSPTFDLSMFGKSMTAPTQQAVPTVGTVEDFLASYGNFEENLFKKGGSIHIKPSHRGRLTELKRRTGKSEAELYNDGNPAHKKMVVFARNARKWKHEDGGKLNIKDMNIFDFGGGLTHGSDWDTGINWVNEGGSHGENPLGGVQMGVDEQGVPNLVEEGEAIWNGDYVFSKRMKVPKKLAQKYGLGGDLTFADAIAKLTKDSEERPLSNIDRATNDHILGEFADTQEELRMAKAQRAMDKEVQLQDDFLTGFQFGLGGHMSPIGIIPDADNISPFEKVEQLYADGGDLFTNPFAYGGELGNVFAGEGNKANRLSPEESARYSQALNAAQQRSIIASLFGDDSPITRTVERIGEVVEDPIGYFAGDQIDAIMNRVAQMSQPQMEKFFSTSLGQAVAKGVVEADKYLSSGTGDNIQKAGVNRWYKATGRMAKPIYRATVNAAKRAMAQSKQVARGQMKTPKGGGKPTSVTETKTPAQIARENLPTLRAQRDSRLPALRGSSEIAAINNSTALSPVRGTTSMSPFTRGVTEIGFPTQTKLNATLPFWGGLGIAAGNLMNWEGEPELDAITGAARVQRPADRQAGTVNTTKKGTPVTPSREKGKATRQDIPSQLLEFEPFVDESLKAPEPKAETNPNALREAIAMDGYTPEYTANDAAIVNTLTPGTTEQSSSFTPKQTWTRYAPLVMSGLMGLKEMLTPADYGNADSIMEAAYQVGSPVSIGTEYIGDYRKRDPFDERYLMNIINQRGSATNRNMMNLSGGNRAVAMSGILANDLTTQMSLAEAARQAYLANRADDADVAAFNKDTNKYNATAQNQRNQFLAGLNSQRQQAMLSGISQGARLRQAIKEQRDAAIYGNLSNFAQGLGDIGWENSQYNMIGGLADEDVLKYIFDKDFITTYKNRLNKNNTGEG